MERKEKNKKKLVRKLLHKYRLVILNEDTFEERFSFRLSRLNVFVTAGFLTIILIVLTALLIAFTPLREYIPGYSSSELKREALMLSFKVDSLEHTIEKNNQYFSSIQQILRGDDPTEQEENTRELASSSSTDPVPAPEVTLEDLDLSPSKTDSILRKEVEKSEKYNIFESKSEASGFKLFKPVSGIVSQPFNVKEQHFGIDISLDENTSIKAVERGIVIFAEWTLETGFVIIIKHDGELISIYKHNLSLTKKQGDYVKKGEVIAFSGNTGEYTTGPHLHFELWKDGNPLNPSDFFEFE